ncbi:universal stress protein UspA-like protein [Mycolicibacterium chubuense NBB4]|uniref:Universal stress protein UspA-like protein n=1 Tax=Mycolicibacterium chubuense (strain NBB4) TaxID=710421 RepID=I4BEU9_MYCCN|nr:universal stress protein [Mycolicibacterium chubuense]AFM15806.1 universal stress protein UspA-like protein [Mycolicibacterium chubuense NBB4]
MPTNVLVGYDGSPAAGAAIDAGAALFPGAHAWITYIWMPPFAGKRLRRRLRETARTADELVELIEREGRREADTIVRAGVALGKAAEWDAEPLVKRAIGSDGLRLAQLAEKLAADVMIIGARGLGGTEAAIGSVSDMAVHYATVPVLVIPSPLLADEFDALSSGPVVVGYDGSDGAESAVEKARHVFPERRLLLAAVAGDGEKVEAGPCAQGLDMVTLERASRFGAPRDRGIADTLAACADDHDAAVVVVGSRGQAAAREILLGSVAVATVHRSHRPVLVVHG